MELLRSAAGHGVAKRSRLWIIPAANLWEPGGSPKPALKGRDVVSFTLDPQKNPKWIDLHLGEKDKKLTILKGIYTIKDDEVRIAVTFKTGTLSGGKFFEPAKERPTSFDAKKPPKDCWVAVIVLQRAQAPAKEPPVQTIAYNGFGAVALSPDGKWVAASGAPGTTVRVWNTATGKEMAELRGHESEVMMAVASSDGKRLFTAARDDVRIWEVATGKQLQCIPAGPTWILNQMTLSADSKWFLSDPDLTAEQSPEDGRHILATMQLWETDTGKEAHSFHIKRTTSELARDYAEYFICGVPRSDEVLGTALSQDGKYVAIGTRRGLVHVWEASSGKELGTFGRSNDYAAQPVGFSRDGKCLATRVSTIKARKLGDTLIRLWDVTTGKEKHAIKISEHDFGAALSDDAQWLMTGITEKTVRLWDINTGKEVHTFAGVKETVSHARLSKDKKILATFARNNTAQLWEVATGKELRALKVGTSNDHVLFSADAKTLVTWSVSRLTLWDLENGKEIRSMDR